jgi:hypothetical protein
MASSLKYVKDCAQCGKPFGPQDVTWAHNFPRMKYCSAACAHARKKFSMERFIEAFWAKVHKGERCWLWQGAKKHDGYGLINRHGKMMLAHRFAWEQANGPIPAGKFALHHCDTPACVNPSHMYLGTKKDNAADMYARGRDGSSGEKNIHAKLTEEQARKILTLKGSISGVKLAKEYDVYPGTIHAIWRRHTWKHIQ